MGSRSLLKLVVGSSGIKGSSVYPRSLCLIGIQRFNHVDYGEEVVSGNPPPYWMKLQRISVDQLEPCFSPGHEMA